MFSLADYLTEKTARIDRALVRVIDDLDDASGTLKEAVRYSVFAGGKRLRPILTVSAARAVGGKEEDAVQAGAAIECIHTYSLIHDDLPAMDDDDLRRGVPTNHKVFGEAIAILAGDCLLTKAFSLLSDDSLYQCDGGRLLKVAHEIAEAAGERGMLGGQTADIEAQQREIDSASLEFIHVRKTGALIVASVRAGALLGGATERQLSDLTDYARNLGLAFQIADDILDMTGSAQTLGKTTGKDHIKGKATYPILLGLAESKVRAQELIDRAHGSLSAFGNEAEPLRAIARFVIERQV